MKLANETIFENIYLKKHLTWFLTAVDNSKTNTQLKYFVMILVTVAGTEMILNDSKSYWI